MNILVINAISNINILLNINNVRIRYVSPLSSFALAYHHLNITLSRRALWSNHASIICIDLLFIYGKLDRLVPDPGLTNWSQQLRYQVAPIFYAVLVMTTPCKLRIYLFKNIGIGWSGNCCLLGVSQLG